MNQSIKFISCNLCGQSKERIIATQNSYKMVECINCGFIYLNPRPNEEVLNQLYQTYHSRNSDGASSWALLMNKIYKETAHCIRKRFPDPGKLLDIGCGYGHFLNLMKNYGWDTFGLEPSTPATAYARTLKLKVSCETLENTSHNSNSFNVITMFYVLEHLSDPVTALLKVNNILKPGGLLVLRVPHTTPIVKLLSSVGIKNNLYDIPFHLSDFSPKTIQSVLEKTGFEAIHTFPGKSTNPKKYLERFASIFFGTSARVFYRLSFGKLLLSGVSKTTIAEKPAKTNCKT